MSHRHTSSLRQLTIIVGLLCGVAHADIGGSVDPLGIERYPHSIIVAYERDDALLPREFAIGRVDKTRRDVRIKREARPTATREWATYEMPAGVKTDDVVRHYQAGLGASSIFTCSGRDCGRSNHWANYIFNQAILYGPDKSQFYLAAERSDHLLAVYVIERGNKRVYAHLEVLKPDPPISLRGNAEVVQRLTGVGLSHIDGVTPAIDGTLNAAAELVLHDLGVELNALSGQTVYVVCHLYGTQNTDLLLDQSRLCARQAAEALQNETGPTFEAFGAGPLMPRASGATSRLELVLPHRLHRE